MIEEMIPIVLFLVVALVVYLLVYFRFRARREMHVTVRAALDKGVELPEAIVARLGEPIRSARADLRRGALFVAVAMGFFAFALTLGEEDAIRPIFASGTFPLLVGIAYLGLWRFDDTPR